eukprot:15441483-Alexandrium_andersonii.AAC.1
MGVQPTHASTCRCAARAPPPCPPRTSATGQDAAQPPHCDRNPTKPGLRRGRGAHDPSTVNSPRRIQPSTTARVSPRQHNSE